MRSSTTTLLMTATLFFLITIITIITITSVHSSPLPLPPSPLFHSLLSSSSSSTTNANNLTLPPFSVFGNQLLQQLPDGSSKPVILHGVNSVGALWFCLGGYGIFDHPIKPSIFQSMKRWSNNMNIVRFSLNEDCWLDINDLPNQKYLGQAYQAAIEEYLQLMIENGFYVIMELHWTAPGKNQSRSQLPMPDMDHAPAFWKSVASRFGKYSGHVLFDVFNEPFPNQNSVGQDEAPWLCWQNGGYDCPDLNYNAAGMQQLVDAVRSSGAKNIILLGGVNYANSLIHWVKYKPHDPLNQLVASWHSYSKNYCNNEECWNKYILPVTKSVPVIAGEIGENDCTAKFINPLMQWLFDNKISFLGWVWDTYSDCKLGPSLVTDIYTGNCTESYGCGFKEFVNKNL